ncbi:divergent polysaccharide deacetylase family protein [Tatumella sp. TA1]|uniref:divergent polysaccharide deacetylase family protein n=1 Tax=Rosenbergiella collisarenosi TaxID=1544695 RepID=UPI0008F80F6B|nr:divergent polysaccharide deacetylase family protein [Rosenbergiella collisarenosi]QGX93036.1 divergent polysaccharide deacetylase family protein [Tatumella sp. TA1]
MRNLFQSLLTLGLLTFAYSTYAGQLALVIDDFGYRPTEEHKVISLPNAISIAVLPDAPHSRSMAILAHQAGHEVLIHLPMAPMSKQPLEVNTLTPEMSQNQVQSIIEHAIRQVPYAVGLNNHMGSRMTSSLPAMQKVMSVLNHHQLYFLDSVTIGNTQAVNAARGTSVKVLKRNVFLDDTQNEADIRYQFQRAVKLAQRNGSAIAIGHPHPTTVKVLQQLLPTLPADVKLVRLSQLLSRTPISAQSPSKPQLSLDARCPRTHPLRQHKPAEGVMIIYTSLRDSQFMRNIKALF